MEPPRSDSCTHSYGLTQTEPAVNVICLGLGEQHGLSHLQLGDTQGQEKGQGGNAPVGCEEAWHLNGIKFHESTPSVS